jgi:hypothetical protein
MKNIKCIYWWLSGVFVLATILVFILIESDIIDKDVTGVLLSGVAIIISIIAMGLSDKKLNKFVGVVIIKKNSRNELVKFTIQNKSDEAVIDFIYKVRFPKCMTFADNKNIYARNFISGYSKQIVDDSWGFLPSKYDGENKIEFSLTIPFSKWNKDNIWISVSGSNIAPTVFILKFDEKENINLGNEITISPKNI